MRISLLQTAGYRARDMRELEEQRDAESFGITIGGRYQDDEMLAAVKNAIKAELQRRIDVIKGQLVDMGVEVE